MNVLVDKTAARIYGDVLDDSLEESRRMMAVNLEAVDYGPKFVALDYGRAGFRAHHLRVIGPSLATDGRARAYAAAGDSIVSLTQTIAFGLAPYGVIINAIAPGYTHTPMPILDRKDETTSDFFQTTVT